MLLFVAHAKFTKHEVKCRFYGPCAVASAVLNGVTLRPLTEVSSHVWERLWCRPGSWFLCWS